MQLSVDCQLLVNNEDNLLEKLLNINQVIKTSSIRISKLVPILNVFFKGFLGC